MKINFYSTLINGINQSSFKKNQTNSTPTPQLSNSSSNSEKAFTVAISNEAKIKRSQDYSGSDFSMNPDFPPDYAPDGVKKSMAISYIKLTAKS